MSRNWIKLWVDLLDDDKLYQVEDSLKWLFVEFMLLAGEQDRNGYVGELEWISWRLRREEESIRSGTDRLAEAQVVRISGEKVHIKNWKNRQPPTTSTERTQSRRKRLLNDEATLPQREDKNREEKEEREEIVKPQEQIPEPEQPWMLEDKTETTMEEALACFVYYANQHRAKQSDPAHCADLKFNLIMKYDRLIEGWTAYRLIIAGIKRASASNKEEKLDWKWVAYNCDYIMEEWLKEGMEGGTPEDFKMKLW